MGKMKHVPNHQTARISEIFMSIIHLEREQSNLDDKVGVPNHNSLESGTLPYYQPGGSTTGGFVENFHHGTPKACGLRKPPW